VKLMTTRLWRDDPAHPIRHIDVVVTSAPPVGFDSGVTRHYGFTIRCGPVDGELEGPWGGDVKREHWDPERDARDIVYALLASLPGPTVAAVRDALIARGKLLHEED
jgi:hypothetical protein